MAGVVSVVAKHTVPLGEWPGLLDFLSHCSAAPEAAHREVALVLFAALTETIGARVQGLGVGYRLLGYKSKSPGGSAGAVCGADRDNGCGCAGFAE